MIAVGDHIKVVAPTSRHFRQIGKVTLAGPRRLKVRFQFKGQQERYIAVKDAKRLRTGPPPANLISPSRPPPRRQSSSLDDTSDEHATGTDAISAALLQFIARTIARLFRSHSVTDRQFEAHIQDFAARLRTLSEVPNSSDL